ncbi:GntR family transcriptional regulator / MocR family aminotransferase [Clostridium sp. DSM 8431]|uniref:MocR-like pyridoxine biosynthesis transcription factor PdxR n=1 Tax=Clostridium sp. DSM 8431 TaxID=1761781 RepID=UPI0008E3D1C2|nr:PLP-dependent aminotransferase family protein [Clostridium sp. DSM 8431]SFU31781.1 GntR family transcriptional regulator / MocR family aminotransferase [Clostridium sp. DSM 8431]
MLTYNFVNIGSDSLYMYLYKCIKKDIKEGRLKAQEKLPSKRALSKNLGISVITVENAYSQLIAEGYIYSLPKKGFYVSDLKDSAVEKIEENFDNLNLSHEEKRYIADFTSNQTDSEAFPFSIWAKTMREVMNDKQTQLMINAPCGGIMELRKEISEYLKEFRGMKVNPEQIIIGAGTEYLYTLIIQLLDKKTVYGVENPGYKKIAKVYGSMNVPYEHIDIDNLGVPVEALEEKNIDVMHISPSHHFPTGIVMPISRRYELLGWASKKKGRFIIEDDYDSELRLLGKPIPTLQSIDVSGKVIYMNTFTKTLCSTVRISYMVLPEELSYKFYKKLSFYSCTVSNFEQYTLAKFLQNGCFEKHINRLRKYYQNKRDKILKSLNKAPIREFITITEEEAGVHFLMNINSKKSEDEIVKEAEDKGIKLVPLSEYYCGSEEKFLNTYVMNYSSINTQNISKIVSALYEVVC